MVARSMVLGSIELCVRKVPSGGLENVFKLVRLILQVIRFHGEEAARKDLPVIPVETLEELGVTVFV